VDIAAWLSGLGLERYADAFRENAIGFDVLPQLTDEHLKDLGLPLGDRLRLLKAVAVLAGSAEPRSAAEAKPDTSPEPPPNARPAKAERRQLTVLFCDLVGSTTLVARLDPEDMGAIIRAYHRCCAKVVERWGGHVARYMGDGVLAYFGWPQAHEDEAERAVRAGLDLTAAVGQLQAGNISPLAARVGIATGLVMVGELIGEGAAQEEAVVGETPNLAARLQALAKPGSVVISHATRRLVGGLFELADLGPRRLKGFAEPLSAWRVEGEGRAEGRFEALHGERLTPLVGREHELGILLERWAWAKDGDGQIVLLAGEPGIGKSRLTRSLIERMIDEPHTRLRYYCSPYHTTSALYPVTEQLERAAGLLADDAAETKLDKLEAMLAEVTENLADVVSLLAALLSIPAEPRYPAVNLTPEVQKLRTFEALLGQVFRLADRRPVLMVLEDAQWVDPTTSDWFGLVIDRMQRLPLLLVITFRPEFSPPWTGQAHVTSLKLSRLGQRQGAQIVERLTRSKPLPAEVLQQILSKTDGVPLFVEELTKTVLESGLLADAGDRYELSGPLPPLAIPATLHDSLIARLDRLAPVKEVAQIGAVIGREFSHELLAAVSPLSEDKLGEALDQLVTSELVFRRGSPPDATYAFKHALVQDAAYQSLLRNRRQQFHARIAKALEAIPDAAETQPELLAHHFTEAGLARPAVDYWLKAGELAIRRSATAEAIAALRRGLEQVERLPGDLERASLELDLRTALGGALITARGFAAPETGKAYTQARELCRQLGQPPQLFRVLYGQYAFHVMRAELDESLAIAKELLRAAQDQHQTAPLVMGHRAVGIASFHRGELAAARAHLEQACALYDAPQHRSLAFLYVFDPFVASASYLSSSLFALGHPEKARARGDAALAWARELAHPASVAFALNFACRLAQWAGNRQVVQEQADELRALASQHGFAFWATIAMIFEGWSSAGQRRGSEGVSRIREGITALTATGAALFVPHFLVLLAQAQRYHGQLPQAEETLADALARVRRTGARYYEAELLRNWGELLLGRPTPDPSTADRCLVEALETARRQEAKMWELRAATSLARLWRDQGRRTEAHDLLGPVYDWFTEGFDTADLKDAKGLLDELG
jgi:class 3 adenylate cyclase/predicted ATPase